MQMKNVKKSFRKVEKTTIITGLAIAVVFLLLWPVIGNYEYEGLIGYLLGMSSIIIFAEGFFLIQDKPKIYLIVFLIFMNIKLVILASLIYLLHKVGISAIHTIIGALTSHTITTITLLITLHNDHSLNTIGQASSSLENNNKANT